MPKLERIGVRIDEVRKKKLLVVLDERYYGLPISKWIEKQIKDEIEEFERKNGPIQVSDN